MNKEKIFYLIGMILGLLVIMMGVILIFTPAKAYSTTTVKSVTFGGDYYTEEYKATKAAVSNAAAIANNIRELGEKLALYVGLAFITAGTFIDLHYAKKFFCMPVSVSAAPQVNISTGVPGAAPSQEEAAVKTEEQLPNI